jgi:hypothetical protein
MSKVLAVLVLASVALVGLAGCSKPDAAVSSAADRKSFVGPPPKPGEIEAAMARARKAPPLAQPTVPNQPK